MSDPNRTPQISAVAEDPDAIARRDHALGLARQYFAGTLMANSQYGFIDGERGVFDAVHREWSFPVFSRPFYDEQFRARIDTVVVSETGDVWTLQSREQIDVRLEEHARSYHHALLCALVTRQMHSS